MRLGIGLNITRQNEVFRLSNLFAGDTAGIYHNFSDLTSLYTDSAGATPLTTPDTTVGLVADRSRVRSPVTVAAGIQASAGLRPKWGRAPKVRRNKSPVSEPTSAQLSNTTGVTDAGTSITGFTNSLTFPGGTVGNRIAYRDHGALASTQYTLSCFIQMDDGGAAVGGTDFTIVIGNASSGGSYATPVDMGGGIWRVARTLTSAAVSLSNTGLFKTDAQSTRGFRVSGFQLDAGATATAYQKTTSAFDMTEAGLPSHGFTRPDRSDDVLATTIPADQTGDVAIFGRNGSWIENAKTYAAASTFSLGATTATGLASGVLAAVGDIVGVLAIGKALSDAEKQLALDYHAARGAAGWLTAGAEMLTNGDFASDTVWTKGTDWTIAAGVATKVAGVASVLAQAVAPTALVAYQLDFTVTRTAGTVTPRFTGGTTVSGAAVSASGTYRQLLVAASGNTAVDFSADATFAGTIDNVSLKPLVAA